MSRGVVSSPGQSPGSKGKDVHCPEHGGLPDTIQINLCFGKSLFLGDSPPLKGSIRRGSVVYDISSL